MNSMRRIIAGVSGIAACAILFLAAHVHAQVRPPPFPRGAEIAAVGPEGQPVDLPYIVNDASGEQWLVYQAGWFQQQGNQPLYSQSAMLSVNGNQPQMRHNQVRLERQTGELVLERMSAGIFAITRRILIDHQRGFVRYLDVIENTSDRDQPANVQVASQLMNEIVLTTPLTDPRDKTQRLGWIGQSEQGRAAMEIVAGRGATVLPQLQWHEPNRRLVLSAQLSVPAGQSVALLHVHGSAASEEQARELAGTLTQRELLASVPQDLRPIVANFATRRRLVADREVLRGELFDVIELRGGDQIHGTLSAQSYTVQGFGGAMTLPASQVLGMIVLGESRPRVLIIAADGQIIGGTLEGQTIAMELSSGQTTQVPISRIDRVGYRRRSDESEEWSLDKPHMVLRGGDRIAIAPPAGPLSLITRYGAVQVDPSTVAAVVLVSQDHGVHELVLSDGTRLLGLLPDQEMPLAVLSGAQPQVVSVPLRVLERIQLMSAEIEPSSAGPLLELVSGERLVGTLSGELELRTAFDTLRIEASELRGLTPVAELPGTVQVELYDGSALRAELGDALLTCSLRSGLSLRVPALMVQDYRHLEPRPPAAVAQQIRAVVAELNADDWQVRESAEARLQAMGAVAAPILRELRDSQPPEARQRIDQILARLSAATAPATDAPAAAPTVPAPFLE